MMFWVAEIRLELSGPSTNYLIESESDMLIEVNFVILAVKEKNVSISMGYSNRTNLAFRVWFIKNRK